MSQEEFEEYFNSIVNSKEFQELDNFLNISKMEGKTILEKLKMFLVYQQQNGSISSSEYKHFYDFFEAYRNKECKKYLDENGVLDLSKTLCFKQPIGFGQQPGNFTAGYYMFSDGSIYLSKMPLYYADEFSLVDDTNCQYIPVIATGIAKQLGIDTSENILGIQDSGEFRILSKYFLKPNEELITFFNYTPGQKISEVFNILERNLRLRKFPENQIEKAKLDFLKQEFMAKLIGLCDQTEDNTTLIVSTDEEGKKTVRMAPMYDYDFSFNATVNFRVRECDNGKTDIASFVEQYKNYPEFLNFVKKSTSNLDMGEVYENIYKETFLKFFENPREKRIYRDDYTKFVNTSLHMVKMLLKRFEKRKNEIIK